MSEYGCHWKQTQGGAALGFRVRVEYLNPKLLHWALKMQEDPAATDNLLTT